MNTYEYSCSHCSYFIETSGPWPYYGKDSKKVDRNEPIHDVSGPIHGLTARVYCPVCDKEKDYVIVKYKKPLTKLDDIWLETIPRTTRMTCHKCKHPVYLILPDASITCPRCKRGKFQPFRFEEDARRSYPVPPTKTSLKVRQNGKSITVPKPTRCYRFRRAHGLHV